jgi:hypothetical protein
MADWAGSIEKLIAEKLDIRVVNGLASQKYPVGHWHASRVG